MRRFVLPRWVISLMAIVLAALGMVAINETSFRESSSALDRMETSQRVRTDLGQLMQEVVDAETGQRGYLLTGEERYLEPYRQSSSAIGTTLDRLRSGYRDHPERLPGFTELARQVSRKLTEIDLSIRLRRQGNEDAWRVVMLTDLGREHMDSIRRLNRELVTANRVEMEQGQRQVQRSLRLARLGIPAVALVGLLAFYLYLRQNDQLKMAGESQQRALEHERDRLGEQVRERTASLAELATHLQEVREQERNHLARELHDELGSLLTAAKLDVARIKSKAGTDSPDMVERLRHLTETLNTGIALKRRIIEDLRPSSLSNLGLVAALEILGREVGERSGLVINTRVDATRLAAGVQLTVYRVVQEALVNINKHAHAQKIAVTLHQRGERVVAEIVDDGDGFEAAHLPAGGHGIAGMRHRVEAAGGTLEIVSSRGAGTRITAVLPASGVPSDDDPLSRHPPTG